MREMCGECPFNPDSPTFKYRDSWVKDKYEFYYGDAHASGSAQQSRLVNSGQDAHSHGVDDT